MNTYILPVDEPGSLTKTHYELLADLAKRDHNLAGKLLAYWVTGKPRFELSKGETHRLVVHMRNFEASPNVRQH